MGGPIIDLSRRGSIPPADVVILIGASGSRVMKARRVPSGSGTRSIAISDGREAAGP
jgi:hypothetical protein